MPSLIAILGLDATGFRGGLEAARLQADRMGPRITTGLTSRLTSALSAVAVTAFAKEIIRLGSEIKDMATRMNVSTDAAQQFAFAAKQTGAEVGDVATAMKKLREAMIESSGKANILQAFERLGFNFERLSRSSPEQVFRGIADAVQRLGATSQVTADLADIFGRGGDKLLPMLLELQSLSEQAARNGLIISAKDIERLDEAGDKIDALILKMKVLTAPQVSALADFATNIANFPNRIKAAWDAALEASARSLDTGAAGGPMPAAVQARALGYMFGIGDATGRSAVEKAINKIAKEVADTVVIPQFHKFAEVDRFQMRLRDLQDEEAMQIENYNATRGNKSPAARLAQATNMSLNALQQIGGYAPVPPGELRMQNDVAEIKRHVSDIARTRTDSGVNY